MSTRLMALALAFAFPAGSTTAATIHVPAEQPTIQAGLDAAQAGDSVVVACGIYHEHAIFLKSGVTLRSVTGEPDCVAIDAELQDRVLIGNLVNTATVVEGITIRNGQTNLSGAGLHCYAGSPEFLRCRFESSHAGGGGAVAYTDGSFPRFVGCTFIDNSAGGNGGAVLGYGPGDHAEFTDCLFVGNDAGGLGGAIALDPIGGVNSATLVGCTLRGNQSAASGGAVFLRRADITMERCIIAFSEDRAVRLFESSTAALTCCDLFGNQAGDWIDELAEQSGADGNISADPLFCDVDNSGLHGASPCAPGNHPAGDDCGLIGALPVDCDPTATEATSWSRVKSLY